VKNGNMWALIKLVVIIMVAIYSAKMTIKITKYMHIIEHNNTGK